VLHTGVETLEISGLNIPRHYGDPGAEYAAARRGAVVVLRSHEGRLRAVGRDRLSLLDRLSTNDLAGMEVGEARPTVLTTPLGRMVDVLWVLNRGETVLCLTGPGRAAAVRRWLAGHIFFRDEVKVADVASDFGQLGIYGPRAGELAQVLFPGAEALAEGRFVERDDLIVLRARPLAGDGFAVIAPPERVQAAWDQVVAAGAVPAGEEAYHLLRLAAGQPHGGHEITGEYIPLEANLWSAVSFSKGCYTGQEIIARMESRGKLARRLVGMRLEAPVDVGSEVQVGDALAGSVTSAGVLPDAGPVALGYLKTAHAEPGTHVRAGGVAGVVAAVPFV
jgi:aminomethyltransferase